MNKIVIDHLDSVTGWVVNAPSTITAQTFPDFIAGLNSSSLQIKFDSLDGTRTAVKTFGTPFDVTDQNTLIFSVWSREKRRGSYSKASDFSYKIKINDTSEYYFPCYDTFTDINIGIESITNITKIEITPTHADTDYLIISEMIAEVETIPLDVLLATQEQLEYFIEKDFPDGIQVGTIATGTTGDTSITFATNPDYLEQYAVVKVKDGSWEEIVQIGDNDGLVFNLIPYLGEPGGLVNDYTTATVYLQFPVYLNPNQIDIRLPGIALWGIDPEPILRTGKVDTQTDTFSVTSDNFRQRKEEQILLYTILVDCEAHNAELIDKMTRVVRKFIAQEILWINGRKHEINFAGAPTEQRPEVGFDIIQKLQYTFTVEVRENIFDREAVPKVTTQTITATPSLGGL